MTANTAQATPSTAPSVYMSKREVSELLRVHIRTINDYMELPEFPRPFRWNSGPASRPVWRTDEIEAWAESRRA